MEREIDRPAEFERHRSRLFGIAYRMLGSVEDAKEIVQETYLRWHRADAAAVRVPEAWLVAVTTRLSIDRLRSAAFERERYVGDWLPEPIATDEPSVTDRRAEIASDLSMAFLVLLERLAPEERAAFLLREVFDTGYDEIARILARRPDAVRQMVHRARARVLGKSEVACRQIVSRARKRVKAERPRVKVSAAASARLVEGLMQAIRAQDRDAMLGLLAAEATWTSDGGGRAKAALKVIRGAPKVARFATGVYRKLIDRVEFRRVIVNGEPGFATLMDGVLFSVMAVRTDGRRILDVYAILNPEKLKGISVPPR